MLCWIEQAGPTDNAHNPFGSPCCKCSTAVPCRCGCGSPRPCPMVFWCKELPYSRSSYEEVVRRGVVSSDLQIRLEAKEHRAWWVGEKRTRDEHDCNPHRWMRADHSILRIRDRQWSRSPERGWGRGCAPSGCSLSLQMLPLCSKWYKLGLSLQYDRYSRWEMADCSNNSCISKKQAPLWFHNKVCERKCHSLNICIRDPIRFQAFDKLYTMKELEITNMHFALDLEKRSTLLFVCIGISTR